MTKIIGRFGALVASLCLILTALAITVAKADSPANEYFDRTWQRTDKPVADLQTNRTWIWGPQAFTGELQEPYLEAPGSERTVQYFDKSRMEITSDPSVATDSPWYVTNGLLVQELITGELQVGDSTFETHSPAQINVAGHADDSTGPTYATFRSLLNAPTVAGDSVITQRVDRSGVISDDPSLAEEGVVAAFRVQIGGIDRQVASPFWEFMNSKGLTFQGGAYIEDQLFPNPAYATGYPITDAYWTNVKVGGVYSDVLVQCFERRCLTYTPDNAPSWQVEAGNVGRHYYTWRYEQLPSIEQPPSESSPTATMPGVSIDPAFTATPTSTQPVPTATPIVVPPTATLAPTNPPPTATATSSPNATPADPPLSNAYLYPEGAVLSALREQCECEPSTGNPLVQNTLDKAYTFRHQYHLATTNIGSFNRDTTEFYIWLTELLEALSTPGTTAQSFNEQVNAAIYQPSSPIGIQLRRLEAGMDPLFAQFGAGPEVYWTYLIDPAIRMRINPIGYDAYRGMFNDYVLEYQAKLASNPSMAMNFGDYLASIGYSLP